VRPVSFARLTRLRAGAWRPMQALEPPGTTLIMPAGHAFPSSLVLDSISLPPDNGRITHA
jgi:hypothetical protein